MSSEFEENPKYSKDDVVNIVHKIWNKVGNENYSLKSAVSKELNDLLQIIEVGLQDFYDVPVSVNQDYIPKLTQELDAAMKQTENSTNVILDACDKISPLLASDVGAEQRKVIEEEVTKIYEACGFQDLSGQRITKTIRILAEIDGKLKGLIEFVGSDSVSDPLVARDEPQSLMNGPQLPGKGISQEDIDKLLADF